MKAINAQGERGQVIVGRARVLPARRLEFRSHRSQKQTYAPQQSARRLRAFVPDFLHNLKISCHARIAAHAARVRRREIAS
jgi:hypothetical protein